jgi:hypothetical protein
MLDMVQIDTALSHFPSLLLVQVMVFGGQELTLNKVQIDMVLSRFHLVSQLVQEMML